MAKPKRNEETVVFTETTAKTDLSTHANKAEPYLIQISGRDTGQMYNLSKSVRIGRDPSCEIAVDDPHVSRVHAEIRRTEDNNLILEDRGSTNGVFVNGQKITAGKALVDGDKILIGTRMYFRFAYQDAVDQSYQQNLFRAANLDALTQLYNKKYFLDMLAKEFSFSKRSSQPLSLMMMDVDFFKKINDTYGHVAGDQVLKTIGQHLIKTIRLENVSARYGGEEFSVILRNVNAELASSIAERTRLGLENTVIEFREFKIKVTVSIGITTLQNENFETAEDFIQKADECLYSAKHAGRNRVVTQVPGRK